MSTSTLCDPVCEALSARFDGADASLPPAVVDEHLATCARCQAFVAASQRVRQELRFEAAGPTPDVVASVLVRLDEPIEADERAEHAAVTRARRRPARLPRWLPAAACFAVGLLVGGVLVAGTRSPSPPPAAAATLPEQLAQAKQRVDRVVADLTVTEHGWRADVPTRDFIGRLVYRAPESLDLRLDDRTPGRTLDQPGNDLHVVADGGRYWSAGLRPCPPSTPSCRTGPTTAAVDRRPPFSTATPVPLDLVVPVQSFARARDVQQLGEREQAVGSLGVRPVVGVATTAAQVQPLLDAFHLAGNLRAVFPTDRVELWLDQEWLVPIQVRVTATDDLSRRAWQANHGYTEQPGDEVLDVTIGLESVGGALPPDAFPAAPEGVVPADAEFRDSALEPGRDGLAPTELPEGFVLHRSGLLAPSSSQPVAVRAYTDGGAWVVVSSTGRWTGDRLFGGVGDVVRAETLANGVAYVDEGAATVAIHADELDLAVTGTVTPAELRRIAASLPVHGLPVPSTWSQSASASLAMAVQADPAVLVPHDIGDFGDPAVRIDGSVITMGFTGAGARAFVLTQSPGDHLTPPLDQDVAAVRVRGELAGRYSAARGELEWVDGGRVYALQSSTLSLGELLAVAKRLGPP